MRVLFVPVAVVCIVLVVLIGASLRVPQMHEGGAEAYGRASDIQSTLTEIRDEVASLHKAQTHVNAYVNSHVKACGKLGPDAAAREAAEPQDRPARGRTATEKIQRHAVDSPLSVRASSSVPDSDEDDEASGLKSSSGDGGTTAVDAELRRRGLPVLAEIRNALVNPVDVRQGPNNFPAELQRASSKMRDRNAVCVDAGANLGLYTKGYISRAACSKIYLFEADARNCAAIKKNLGLPKARYDLFCGAISHFVGDGTFFVEEKYAGGPKNFQSHGYLLPLEEGRAHHPPPHFNAISTKVSSIEERVPEGKSIDVLKIDVQGGEATALLGALDLIRAGRIKFIGIEISRTDEISHLVCYLLSLAPSGYSCTDHGRSPIVKGGKVGPKPGKGLNCHDYIDHMDREGYWTDFSCWLN